MSLCEEIDPHFEAAEPQPPAPWDNSSSISDEWRSSPSLGGEIEAIEPQSPPLWDNSLSTWEEWSQSPPLSGGPEETEPQSPVLYEDWEYWTKDPPVSEDSASHAPIEYSNIPISIGHRFFNWLLPFLEGCYVDFANANLDETYLNETLEKMKLKHIIRADLDLPQWRIIMEQAYENNDSKPADFAVSRGYPPLWIFWATDTLRHAAVHRKDITLEELLMAMSLPELLGYSKRQEQVERAFELVNAAADPSNNCEETMNVVKMLLARPEKISTEIDLLAQFQAMIETSLFWYTQRHHPKILECKGWTVPEQGEMPEWLWVYRYCWPVKESDFPANIETLLSLCLIEAKEMRNVVAHRNRRNKDQVLAYVHNSIRTLMVLDDYVSAVEVEILAEQWFRGVTRLDVLARLRDRIHDSDDAGDDISMSSEDVVLMRRREEKRRGAITEILKDTVIPSDFEWRDEWTKPTPLGSSPDIIPHEIPPTEPVERDICRDKFFASMHPILKVLPAPRATETWSEHDLEHDLDVEKWESEWQQTEDSNSDTSGSADRDDVRVVVVLQENDSQGPEDDGTLDGDSDTTLCEDKIKSVNSGLTVADPEDAICYEDYEV